MNYARGQKEYLKARPNAFDSSDLLEYFKPGTFADFQEDRIEQGGNGWSEGWSQMPSEYVRDDSASNGYAAKCSDGKRFEIQLRDTLHKLKSESGNEDSNRFKVYAFLKNPGADIPKGGCTWLNYCGVGRKRIQRVPMEKIPHGDKFSMVELGTFEHSDIKAERKDAVCKKFLLYCGKNSNLLVDRIVFVRQ